MTGTAHDNPAIEIPIIITGGRKRHSSEDYETLRIAVSSYVSEKSEGSSEPFRVVIVQGGCADGVDSMARQLAANEGYDVETYPADFSQHPEDAVGKSNQTMVDRGAALCLAMPNSTEDGPSNGTWDMVSRATTAGIETRIYRIGSMS